MNPNGLWDSNTDLFTAFCQSGNVRFQNTETDWSRKILRLIDQILFCSVPAS